MNERSRMIDEAVLAILPWRSFNSGLLDDIERWARTCDELFQSAFRSALRNFKENNRNLIFASITPTTTARAIFWYYSVPFVLDQSVTKSLAALLEKVNATRTGSLDALNLYRQLVADWTSYNNLTLSYGKQIISQYNINHTRDLKSEITECKWSTLWTNPVWLGIHSERRDAWTFTTLGKTQGMPPDPVKTFDESFTNMQASQEQLTMRAERAVSNLTATTAVRFAVEDYYHVTAFLQPEWIYYRNKLIAELDVKITEQAHDYYTQIHLPRAVHLSSNPYPFTSLYQFIEELGTAIHTAQLQGSADVMTELKKATKIAEDQFIQASDRKMQPSVMGDRSIAYAVLSDYALEYDTTQDRIHNLWHTLKPFTWQLLAPLASNSLKSQFNECLKTANVRCQKFLDGVLSIAQEARPLRHRWDDERQRRWVEHQYTLLVDSWDALRFVISDGMRRLLAPPPQPQSSAAAAVSAPVVPMTLEQIVTNIRQQLTDIKQTLTAPDHILYYQFRNADRLGFSSGRRAIIARYIRTLKLINDTHRIYEQTRDTEPHLVHFKAAAAHLRVANEAFREMRTLCVTGFDGELKQYESVCLNHLTQYHQLLSSSKGPRDLSNELVTEIIPAMRSFLGPLKFTSTDLKELSEFEQRFFTQLQASTTLISKGREYLIKHPFAAATKTSGSGGSAVTAMSFDSTTAWDVYLFPPPVVGNQSRGSEMDTDHDVKATPSATTAAAATATVATTATTMTLPSLARASPSAKQTDIKQFETETAYLQFMHDLRILEKGVAEAAKIVGYKEYTNKLQRQETSIETLLHMLSTTLALRLAHWRFETRHVTI